MAEEHEYLDKPEGCYETEYALRQDVHSRESEILRLEHQNAKLSREIERLNARISTILEPMSDVSHGNLFEYLKALLVELSNKKGYAKINPGNIDVKYVEAACRYCFPVLFDKYTVLDQDDANKIKIQFAEYILRMFGLENMYEYENLHTRGEIELAFIDNRDDTAQEDHRSLPSEDDIHKIELADSILHKFGIETIAMYEELIKYGDIDIDILDHRVPHPPKGL